MTPSQMPVLLVEGLTHRTPPINAHSRGADLTNLCPDVCVVDFEGHQHFIKITHMANIPILRNFTLITNHKEIKGYICIFVYCYMVYKEHNLRVLCNHHGYTIYCPLNLNLNLKGDNWRKLRQRCTIMETVPHSITMI